MTKGKPASPELRAEVVGKIRNEGMSVAVASATYGYSSKAVYAWLREGVVAHVESNWKLICAELLRWKCALIPAPSVWSRT